MCYYDNPPYCDDKSRSSRHWCAPHNLSCGYTIWTLVLQASAVIHDLFVHFMSITVGGGGDLSDLFSE